MDGKKFYHLHGLNSRNHTDTYFSSKSENFETDCLKFHMDNLHTVLTQGHIGGQVLLDMSVGCIIHQLLSAMEYFQDIIVLKVNNKCMMEVKKWIACDAGACDWTHTSSYVVDLEGKSVDCAGKEQKLKKAIKQVLNCNFEKENLTYPVTITPADCIITTEFLECISEDLKGYVKNLEKCAALLKPGGHVLMLGVINATFMVVGKDKLHMLKLTEDEIRESFLQAGFIIDVCNVQERGAPAGHELCDYEGIIFLAAHKPE